ncbi:hypothetical protein GOP47_0003004 [Adiantum capillus-veneris]|uniref:Uncharacterized protein n=1 Tax=Adiantum capillus-veneris TaxID=13818 RepID=A0A9D4ZRF5_ADICA|nr:hypothetical protein GOP47_0003004 [Adiantum capillus-veneris]
MAQGRFPLFDNEATQVHRNNDGAKEKQYTKEAGNGGKGGKLRLSRISLFKKKPYDRPLASGTRASPLPSGRQVSSLPVRLVDSASNLLTSSASYLFESFFKRRQTRWIGNGTQATAGRGSPDTHDSEKSNPLITSDRHSVESSFQEGGDGRLGGGDMGFVEVEEFLKQQSLSREEVKRLTEVLLSRGYGGSVVNTNPEATRRLNMVKQVSEESNPVILAKAYMGRREMPPWQSTSSRPIEVAGPSSRKILLDGTPERGCLEASRACVASGASVRMLKRRLIADDDDDIVLTVPARRVRQRMTVTPNSSPYLRQVTTAMGRPQASIAALKHSDKSEKSPEQSEEVVLPFKGKSVEEPAIATGPIQTEDLPESSKARDSALDSNRQSSELPASNDVPEPSFEPPKPVVTSLSPALEKSVSGSVAMSSELPAILPEKASKRKGFRISAFFEDSSSDEEAIVPITDTALIEAKEGTTRQLFAILPDNIPRSSALDSAKRPVPVERQPNSVAGRPKSLPVVSSAAPSFKPPSMVPTIEKQYTLPSYLPAITNNGRESGEVKASTTTPSPIASSVPLISSPLPVPRPPPDVSPAEASLLVPEAEAVAAPLISLPSETAPGKEPAKKEGAKRKVEATQTGTPEASGLFFASASQPMPASTENVTPSLIAPAAGPKFLAAAEAPTVSASRLPLFAATPAPLPAVNQAGSSETQPFNAVAADSPLEAGGARHSPMFESPITESKQNDVDTMATDPMTEEPDSSILGPSAPVSLFGSTSNAVSTPISETGAFASRPASSPFSFPMQSSTPSEVSQSPFNSQSGSATGQLFPFGTSGSAPASPFSSSSQSAFLFGSSSAASSTSFMFPATSSAPLTFPATSPAPSPFLFGAQASPSSSANSNSVFGGQTALSASGFTGGGVQNNTATFSFQAPPTTPSPPSFPFGGASAGTSSIPSIPSFGGQTFPFGGQPTNVAANPFAQSGGANASPFQFGAAASTASQPVFSSGAAPASNFSFGAQPATSPFSFTFGGQQSTTSSTGQPFGFGNQPAAPAPNPFALPGSTGQAPSGASGMEFTGGFSLGAAGAGEKSGRKFIKAKRIGGAKRGK